MKRRLLLKLVLFLLLGAIINVAVAWAFNVTYGVDAAVYSRSWSKPEPTSEDDLRWLAALGWTKPNDTACHRYFVLRADSSMVGFWQRAFSEDAELLCPGRLSTYAGPIAVRTACGWPLLTLGDALTAYRPDGSILVGGFDHAFAVSVGDTRRRTLPLRPLWPGFAINTVFYTFVLWLLFAVPFVLRRWRRIRRGLCPKCAYDLRGTASVACPGCGNVP